MSVKNDVSRFWSKIDQSTVGCWNWLACKNSDGYGKFVFGGFNWSVHRLCWKLTKGGIPDGMLVCHRCDNPSCVNPDHLFLGTDADNSRDAAIKDRRSQKLTIDQVIEVRRLVDTGSSQKEVGNLFGVNPATISRICSFDRRQHVLDTPE
jgi:hypothetical protein